MKILAKLLTGFIAVAVLCGIVGVVGIMQISSLDKNLVALAEETIPSLNALSSIDLELTNLKVAIRTLSNPLTIDDEATYKRQLANIEKARTSYKAALEKFEAIPNVPEEAKLWKEVTALIGPAAAYNNTIMELATKAKNAGPEEREAYFREIYALISGDERLVFDNVQNAVRKVLTYDQQYYGIDLPKQAIQSANTGKVILIIVTILAFIVALILGIILGTSIANPLKKSVAILDKLAAGDISEKMEVKSKDEFMQVATSLNGVIATVGALIGEAEMLTKAAVDGRLSTRGDASKFKGGYHSIVEGVNKTLDAVIGPLNVAANYVDRISKGDLPPKITDSYNGDFNEIKNNLNLAIDNINALVVDAGLLVQAAVDGKLSTRADATKHQGDYRKIVDGVNKTLDAVIGPLNVTAKYVDDISKGVIPPVITDSYNGDFNIIKNNLNSVVKMMSDLLRETDVIIRAAADGDLDKRANADIFLGGWNQLVKGVNETITNIVNPLMVTADYVDKISRGAIPEQITSVYKGQYNIIKTNLNACIVAINALVSDASILVEAAIDGKLSTRADATKHQGDYKKIVDGVNKTLDLVITPVNETIAILTRLAEGDMTLRMNGVYKGDFDILKTSMNDSLESINNTLGEITTAVDQVAEGSLQVSQASQALSQGATEQAASLEEITSSTTEISSQTRTNTENALKVNTLAKGAQDNAQKGNIQMNELVSAMKDINASAEGIKKVVIAIDDIAFQINLLALNANVEAARAGKYGKGFAVVAEEVRNLAVRSASSVKETTIMVDEAISNIQRGNVLVDGTAKQLSEIVDGASQVVVLAEEVATAGREQTQGLEQISLGLNQIDQVTQSNTASAEESASASEELSSQAQQVKSMLGRFKLKAQEGKMNNADVMAMLRTELANRDNSHRQSAPTMASAAKMQNAAVTRSKPSKVNPADIISLDDNNFGKF